MEQLNITFARSRGHAGAELAAEKAERVEPGWIDAAVEDIRHYVRHTDSEFTIEQARSMCRQPPDSVDGRVWGAVTRRAIRLGVIEATGGYAPAASSNGSPKPLYRKGRGA